jgi:hypothetical protein
MKAGWDTPVETGTEREHPDSAWCTVHVSSIAAPLTIHQEGVRFRQGPAKSILLGVTKQGSKGLEHKADQQAAYIRYWLRRHLEIWKNKVACTYFGGDHKQRYA